MISADVFSVLRVDPVAGRLFRHEDDHVGGPPVALISGGFWKREFRLGARRARENAGGVRLGLTQE
jgi:hypothetical protein